MSLKRMALRDFVIVRELELELANGFSVLTGETGAGKSILVDALQLALGSRAEATVVREGAARAEISAEFDPPATRDEASMLRFCARANALARLEGHAHNMSKNVYAKEENRIWGRGRGRPQYTDAVWKLEEQVRNVLIESGHGAHVDSLARDVIYRCVTARGLHVPASYSLEKRWSRAER